MANPGTAPWSFGELECAGQRTRITVSLSGTWIARLGDIWYETAGEATDPRSLFVPSAQLVIPEVTAFGTWATAGVAWEANPPSPTGPFALTFEFGAAAVAVLNPAKAGTYRLAVKLTGAVEAPVFQVGTIILEAP